MKAWALFVSLALFAGGLAAETLVVGLPEPGRRPFFWEDQDKQLHGSYIKLLKRVGEIAGVNIEFRMVPQSRLISEFDSNKIHVEPGIAKEWRPSSREQENSRYTQTFMRMNDVLIQRKGLPLPRVASLLDLQKQPELRVGQVRGFFTPIGIKSIPVYNELDIARMVSSNALDIGFMNENVAEYLRDTYGFEYDISPPISSAAVALRLHRQNEKWVEPFDRAIHQMRSSGELKKLFPE